jgi:sulfur carrier protein ThiS
MVLRITVEENGNSKEMVFKESIDVNHLLESLGRYPDGHIVVLDNVPVPLTEHLSDGDNVKIIRVASGG